MDCYIKPLKSIGLEGLILSCHKVNKVPGSPNECHASEALGQVLATKAQMTEKKDFTPALGYARVTPFYDLAIRLLT